MIYRDASSNCPRCAVPLGEFRVIGVSYRLCPKCAGAWVGFAELGEMFDFMNPQSDPVLQGAGPSRLPCPACRGPMKQALVAAGRGGPSGRRRWARFEEPVPAGPSIALRVELPGQTTEDKLIDKPIIKLGRLATCQVVLDHPSVSRLHAVVELSSPPVIIDLGSASGTHVNGQRQARSPLAIGDVIQLGAATIRVLDAASDRAPPPSEPAEGAAAGSTLRVEVDVCDAHGLWFDRDELARALLAAGASV